MKQKDVINKLERFKAAKIKDVLLISDDGSLCRKNIEGDFANLEPNKIFLKKDCILSKIAKGDYYLNTIFLKELKGIID